MINDFKAFVLRGNVVDLAVGVVIGAAFGTLVASLVENLLTPLVGVPGKTDFSTLEFSIRGAKFRYGVFLNDLVSFMTIAATVFFFVVRPVNSLMAKRKTELGVLSTTKTCLECLSEIPSKASRCAFCTVEVSSSRETSGPPA